MNAADTEISNGYDNTIHIYRLFPFKSHRAFLKETLKMSDTAMFYVSDHGESLGEGGLYLHGMPYFMAPDEQINIAAFMWLDESMSRSF